MDQKKTAFMGLFAAAAHYSGLCGIADSLFRRDTGDQTGACEPGRTFYPGEIHLEGSGSCLRCPHPGSRISLGNMFSILYSLAGAALSLAVMTFMQKKIRIHRHGDQCFRRRFPQYRAACRRRPDRGEFRCSLLCSRSPGLRGDHRTSYRFSYTGSPEAGTPVNLPGIRRSRHNIRISNAETAG